MKLQCKMCCTAIRICYFRTKLQVKQNSPSLLLIGNSSTFMRTKRQMINEYVHVVFITQLEPKKINETLVDSSWIEADSNKVG